MQSAADRQGDFGGSVTLYLYRPVRSGLRYSTGASACFLFSFFEPFLHPGPADTHTSNPTQANAERVTRQKARAVSVPIVVLLDDRLRFSTGNASLIALDPKKVQT
jgi:hypothetical protein